MYGLRDLGAVAPGYRADLVLLSSLKKVKVERVYKDGVPVEDALARCAAAPVPAELLNTVRFEDVRPEDLRLPCLLYTS